MMDAKSNQIKSNQASTVLSYRGNGGWRLGRGLCRLFGCFKIDRLRTGPEGRTASISDCGFEVLVHFVRKQGTFLLGLGLG